MQLSRLSFLAALLILSRSVPLGAEALLAEMTSN
jgi:hypothetical protein